MFTGLVEELGTITSAQGVGTGRTFVIRCTWRDLVLGESIACDGVCLTVERILADGFQATAGDETLRLTTLGARGVGSGLHLERAVRATDRLGGHIVQGHVDGVGTVRTVVPGAQWTDIGIEVPEPLRRYLVRKGSVCVDGVSLTVNTTDDVGFHVGIVPHTLGVTKLGGLRPGDHVNLEVDIVAKYVERLLGAWARGDAPPGSGGLDLAKLKASGFA
jgi:riboflavin synthase